jgi:hypothetical protein
MKKRIYSKLQEDTDYCFICGRYGTEIHHVFFGTGNRKLSDKYGMVVGLCYNHHRGNNGVHFNKELDLKLKRYAQEVFTDIYSEREFLAVFGRNYLL